MKLPKVTLGEWGGGTPGQNVEGGGVVPPNAAVYVDRVETGTLVRNRQQFEFHHGYYPNEKVEYLRQRSKATAVKKIARLIASWREGAVGGCALDRDGSEYNNQDQVPRAGSGAPATPPASKIP